MLKCLKKKMFRSTCAQQKIEWAANALQSRCWLG